MKKNISEKYGYFSLDVSGSGSKYAGKLLNIEAGLVLELIVPKDGDLTEFPDNDDINAIYGILNDGMLISLHQCYKRSSSFGTEHFGVQYHYLKSFIGNEYVTPEVKISSVSFTTNHLFLWTNGHLGYKKDANITTKSCSVSFNNPGETTFVVSSNKKMLTGFDLTVPGWSQDKSDYEIKARPYIHVKSRRVVKFDNLLTDVFSIVRFISFCVLDRVKILSLKACIGKKWFECNIESSLFTNGADTQSALERSHQMRTVFTQREMLVYVKEPIFKWLEFEKKYGEVSRLFYQSLNVNDLPLENLIINLTTAIESYRRTSNPKKDVCLKDAVLEIMKKHRSAIYQKCKISNINEWSQRVADSRNYYAHIAPNKEKKRLKGGKLFSTIINERYLLISVILEELGLSIKSRKEIFNKQFR